MPPSNGSDIALFAAVYGGVILAALWLAMILWTYRDMRSRSRDGLSQLLVSAIVALLTVPGLLIYLMLRPRETLTEAYERSLEEEALLQEIEEKPSCPACGQRTHDSWQVCPNCHTRLKKACMKCGKSLELSWNICPHCATPQATIAVDTIVRAPAPQMQQDTAGRPVMAERAKRRASREARAERTTGSSLEFIDSD
jgi:RNA polymerase subunit RPABC4/transcription elongation factor Spt4